MVPVTCTIRIRKLTEDERRELNEQVQRRQAEAGDTRKNASYDAEQHVMVLREVDGERVLSIMCGRVEGTAIALAQQGVETQRPLTHDLLRDVVSAMGAAREVRITELRDGTFYAELLVADASDSERVISCRPSDGIALAVRTGIPILVAESLFERAS